MARRMPIILPSEAQYSLIPSALFMSLAVAWITAAMAVLISLCVRKSSSKPSSPAGSPPPPPSSNEAPKPASEAVNNAAEASEQEAQPVQEKKAAAAAAAQEEDQVTVIGMAPDVATHGPIPPTVLLPESAGSTSKRKLSLSFSKGLPDKLRTSRREQKVNAAEPEDTIWKKTIILGEKCKVSSDEEEEEVVVDEKGNRQRYYHPRTPRSRQTSRNNSFASRDETSS